MAEKDVKMSDVSQTEHDMYAETRIAVQGAEYILKNRIASGTFCDCYTTDCSVQNSQHICKTFSSRRQFLRTCNAMNALLKYPYQHLGRNHIEDIKNTCVFLYNNYPIYCVIMPQYEVKLSDVLHERSEQQDGFGLPGIFTVMIARQLFNALDCLEKSGIVHGDIKPGNIMFKKRPSLNPKDAQNLQIVLCDFGSARIVNPETRMCAPATVGTFAHIAPEILLGQKYSFPADVWSAMTTLFTVITGGDLLFDIFGSDGLDHKIDTDGIYVDDDDSASKSHATSHRSDDSDNSDDANAAFDIDFPTMYAHIVLMYRVIGKPPKIFCKLAQEYYFNGAPRYSPSVTSGSISQFLDANYKNLSYFQMKQIEEFLRIGLQYMPTDRNSASVILDHLFLADTKKSKSR
jgi:serine/threonine protein kinase